MTPPEILISMSTPSPSDMEDNRNVARAAFGAMRQCRIRVNIGMYAPGTQNKPKPRYYAVLGSAPTLVCKTPAAVDYVMRRINELMVELNGWTSEVNNGE
jgi:hypothetical protein